MTPGDWKFDDSVAAGFDTIARTNIPHYEDVIDKCVMIAEAAFPDKTKARIIDVGSAKGHTLERFRKAGYENVFGVDSSAAMLAQSSVKENLIHSETFPKQHGPFDMVVANWTLHFIPERNRYLRDIRDSLSENGILVLSEKMQSSDFVHARYHDFKRYMGVSEQDIAAKEAAIEGVLVPYPLEWYIDTLREHGFSHIEIIDAAWCFKTILCIK